MIRRRSSLSIEAEGLLEGVEDGLGSEFVGHASHPSTLLPIDGAMMAQCWHTCQ